MAAVQPHPTLLQLLTSGVDLKILSFTQEDADRINDKLDFCFFTELAANIYPGQTEAIPTIAQSVFLVARADMDEELVYQATKALFKDLERLKKTHSALATFGLEKAFDGLKIPLHPGAIRFYKEKGMEIPERLIP